MIGVAVLHMFMVVAILDFDLATQLKGNFLKPRCSHTSKWKSDPLFFCKLCSQHALTDGQRIFPTPPVRLKDKNEAETFHPKESNYIYCFIFPSNKCDITAFVPIY